MASIPALPKRPSDLIRLALDDLKWIEKHPEIAIVDMQYFVKPVKYCYGDEERKSPVCAVCFAGAIMRRRFDVRDAEYADDPQFLKLPKTVQNQMNALDSFRLGRVVGGLTELKMTSAGKKWASTYVGEHDKHSDGEADMEVTAYSDNPVAFRSDMNKLIQKLRRIDL